MGEFFKGYESMPVAKTEKFKLIEYPDCGEGVSALVDSNNYLIMCGDSYHDKIDDRIDGFFDGLGFANMPYTIEVSFRENTDIHDDFHEDGVLK